MSNSSKITTEAGGVITDEVGAVTGDLVVSTNPSDGKTTVTVAYDGAKDVYTVKGSPLGAVVDHDTVINHLTTPAKPDSVGNVPGATVEGLTK